MTKFNLSKKIEKPKGEVDYVLNDGYVSVPNIKEFIRLLKEGCFNCGSKFIHKDGRKFYKTDLCDTCHNALTHKSWSVFKQRNEEKIDKLAGSKLTEEEDEE